MRLARVVLPTMVASVLIGATGCGGDDDDKGDGGARDKTTPAGTTETAPAGPAPEPGTVDGSWSGQTAAGEEIAFEVDGNKISNVTMPGNPKCGNGIGSTIESSTKFRGNRFEVLGLPLPYMIFDKKTGQSTNATETRSVEGRFTSTTEASGRVITRIEENGSSDRCVQKWTAARG